MAGLMQRAARRLGQQCVLLCGARDRALAGAAGLSSSPRPGRDEHAAADRAEPGTVAIDRSGLYQPREHSHGALPHKEPETPVARHLKALIQHRGGPVTLAEYMSEALTNPAHGYYTTRDAFGRDGDFTTSPEISQLFGEMVGIWAAAAWQAAGSPRRARLVELGPGRGTLMADLLRGTAGLRAFAAAAAEVDLVEVSGVLRERQWRALRCAGDPPPAAEPAASVSGITGCKVQWHRSLDDVPADCPTFYIAHEFLDALPVHQFRRTERGWCECLVDVADDGDARHLRMVLAPDTPAARMLLPLRLAGLPPAERDALQGIEVGGQAMAVAADLARRVADAGGGALLVDYGRGAPYAASLQALRRHAVVHPLERPGTADLSVHVDFAALRHAVEATGAAVACHGPMPQGAFLAGLGAVERLHALLAVADDAQADLLLSGARRLMGDAPGGEPGGAPGVAPGSEPAAAAVGGREGEAMGVSYQALAISPAALPPPAPFGAA